MPDRVTVTEVEEPTVGQASARLVITDPRPDPNEMVDGYVEFRLDNGRILHIGGCGICDGEDDGDEHAGYVNWEELLQLLDEFRRLSRLGRVN